MLVNLLQENVEDKDYRFVFNFNLSIILLHLYLFSYFLKSKTPTKRQKISNTSQVEYVAPDRKNILYCEEILPDDIPDAPLDPDNILNISPILDPTWLGDISPTALQELFESPSNTSPLGMLLNDIRKPSPVKFDLDDPPLVTEDLYEDNIVKSDVIPFTEQAPKELPGRQDTIFTSSSFLPNSISSLLGDSSESKQEQHFESKADIVIPPPPSLQTGLFCPLTDCNFDIIRISWYNHMTKRGWVPIRPYPHAISKPKRFLIEPIRVKATDLKLTISVETKGTPQLSFAVPNGTSSSVDMSILPVDNELGRSINSNSGHEIILNCHYARSRQALTRPLHHVKITDNYGRKLLSWSVEVFNPKWEAMTKSPDKPLPKDDCSFVWLTPDGWKQSIGKLPTNNYTLKL